ncbi:MAG: hypothetical protein ACRC5M_04380 [Anaeroplasmataceae bacterium]
MEMEEIKVINVEYSQLSLKATYNSRSNEREKMLLSPEDIDRIFVKKEKLETSRVCDLLSAMIAYEKLSVGFYYLKDNNDYDNCEMVFVKGGIVEVDEKVSKWKLISHKNSFMELARKEVRGQFIGCVNYYHDDIYKDFKIEEDGDYYLFTFSCANNGKYKNNLGNVRPNNTNLEIPHC